jgi:hypothetical protein
MNRLGLTDQQWQAIEGLLSGWADTVGATAWDNHLFVDAVLWIARPPAGVRCKRGMRILAILIIPADAPNPSCERVDTN